MTKASLYSVFAVVMLSAVSSSGVSRAEVPAAPVTVQAAAPVKPVRVADDAMRRLRRTGFDCIKFYNLRPPESGEFC